MRTALRLTATAGLVATALTTGAAVASAAPAAAHRASVQTLVSRCTGSAIAVRTTARARLVAELACVRKVDGLRPLAVSSSVGRLATSWAQHIAAEGVLSHNLQLGTALASVAPDWTDTGETVGTSTGSVDLIVAAYMRSTEHRTIILDPHLHVVGIGLVRSGGAYWNTLDLVDRV